MRVRFWLSIGLSSGDIDYEITLPDESTDEEIEAEFREWRDERIEAGWNKLKCNSEVELSHE